MLKERLELIEKSMKYYSKDYTTREILNLVYEYNLEKYIKNIINREEIDDLVQFRLDGSGWEGVACLLSKINYVTDEYYLLDEYENLEELTKENLECIYKDIKNELLKLMEEE